jgi:putative copper export protein
MTTALDIAMTVHTVFAALWTGGTLLVAGAVIPAARRKLLKREALSLIARRFSYLTIASVLLLLFSGGHLAGTLYTVETLQSTGRGNLVLTMVGLWFVLAVVLFIGFRRLSGISPEKSAATAATKARPWFLGGSVVSIALLVVAGIL